MADTTTVMCHHTWYLQRKRPKWGIAHIGLSALQKGLWAGQRAGAPLHGRALRCVPGT